MESRPLGRWAVGRPATALGFVLMAALAGCGHSSKGIEAAQAQSAPPNPGDMHSVSVTFDYDFTKMPACSSKMKVKTCVKDFVVYDVSGGRYKLFTIPAPVGASGPVKGITAHGPERTFEPGTHFIAVTAENAQGEESNTNAAKVAVEVKRKAISALDATGAKQ